MNSTTKIFAEKSFAVSRIDDIAKSADVPKSLIYYHFKSKDSILETLIQDFTNELRELLLEAKTNENMNKSTMFKFQTYYFTFLEDHKDLIRILLIESLKEDNDATTIFNIVEKLVTNLNAVLELSELEKDKIKSYLKSLPNGNSLCHFDFHPGNVIIKDTSFYVIDWMTACLGNANADVARTSLILEFGELQHVNPFIKAVSHIFDSPQFGVA